MPEINYRPFCPQSFTALTELFELTSVKSTQMKTKHNGININEKI